MQGKSKAGQGKSRAGQKAEAMQADQSAAGSNLVGVQLGLRGQHELWQARL